MLELKVSSDRKRRKNRAVSNLLLGNFISRNVRCDVWHSVDHLARLNIIYRTEPPFKAASLLYRKSKETVGVLKLSGLKDTAAELYNGKLTSRGLSVVTRPQHACL